MYRESSNAPSGSKYLQLIALPMTCLARISTGGDMHGELTGKIKEKVLKTMSFRASCDKAETAYSEHVSHSSIDMGWCLPLIDVLLKWR